MPFCHNTQNIHMLSISHPLTNTHTHTHTHTQRDTMLLSSTWACLCCPVSRLHKGGRPKQNDIAKHEDGELLVHNKTLSMSGAAGGWPTHPLSLPHTHTT